MAGKSQPLHLLIIPLVLFLAANVRPAQGAKILFFFGIGSHSHRVSVQPLVNKLAEAGHEVTFFSKSKMPQHPAVEELFPDFFDKKDWGGPLATSIINNRLRDKHSDPFIEGNNLWDYALASNRDLINSPEFRKWARTGKYDLIIYNSTGKDLAIAIAFKMGAKVIAFMPAASHPNGLDVDMYGLPVEGSWLHDWSLGSRWWFIPDHFVYAYNPLAWYFSFKWYYAPKLDAQIKELFPEDELPSAEDLVRTISLVLLNEHYSTGYARAYPPFVVPVGGMHVEKSNGTLPEALEKFVSAKPRFVFISFGSVIKVSELPESMQKILFNTVSSIQDTNFLWKWEGQIPTNLPSNVLAMNWFPQQDVLAHPKCKGFVTQGGQISVQQAAYNGVPMIVVPIWADQAFNARSLQYHKVGIYQEISELTQESFTHALNEILFNPKYAEEAQEVARRFSDRPLSPVDTAAWWVEYVLRHDTAHLKSPAINQYWWQRRLLDFYVAILIVGILLIVIRIYIGKLVIRYLMKLFRYVKSKVWKQKTE